MFSFIYTQSWPCSKQTRDFREMRLLIIHDSYCCLIQTVPWKLSERMNKEQTTNSAGVTILAIDFIFESDDLISPKWDILPRFVDLFAAKRHKSTIATIEKPSLRPLHTKPLSSASRSVRWPTPSFYSFYARSNLYWPLNYLSVSYCLIIAAFSRYVSLIFSASDNDINEEHREIELPLKSLPLSRLTPAECHFFYRRERWRRKAEQFWPRKLLSLNIKIYNDEGEGNTWRVRFFSSFLHSAVWILLSTASKKSTFSSFHLGILVRRTKRIYIAML